MSPMPDAGLESLLLSASTPRQFVLGSSASGFRPGSSPASGVALVGAVTPRRVDPLLLTFPSGGSSGGVPEELPFAFAEDLSSSRVHALPAALDHGMRDGKGRSSDSSGEGGEAGTPGEAGDAAGVAALGTFMALVRDAKPLSGLTATNLEAGLAQLERVSVSLAAHGVK